MRSRMRSVVSAVIASASAGVVVVLGPAAPTAAAACGGATGVTAIVDFNELDGGVTAGCDGNGAGEPAAQVFVDAGYPLTFTQEDPGFVCRVSGKPASNPCTRTPPPTAYWSLWWSDGRSGRWVYSSSGVNSLEVPDGGYVAFAWHEGDGSAAPPDAAPTPHDEPEPSDDPDDTDPGGGGGGGTGGGGTGGGTRGGNGGGQAATTPVTGAASTASATSSATSSASGAVQAGRPKQRRDRASASQGATSSTTLPAADEITDGPPPSDLATEPGDEDSALPTWIGLGVAVLVLGAAGLVTVLRRRAG